MLFSHYHRHLLMKLPLVYILANIVITEGSTKDQYVGCFYDSSSQLLQWEDTLNVSSMTIELCIEHCQTGGGKTYAKLQNRTVCQCGDNYGTQTLDRACNLTCFGNQSEYCGGITNELPTTYVLYTVCPIGNYSTLCDRVCHCKRQIPCDRATGICPNGCDGNYTGSTCNTTTASTKYIGCFKDDNDDRALPNRVHEYDYKMMAIDACFGWCSENFSTFAGAQFSSECFCGESYNKHGQLNETACNSECLANKSEKCGGPNANSVYSVCPAGNYGQGCSKKCYCVDDGRCVYLNGSCLSSRCKPGWTGSSCNIRDCSTINGDCFENEICISVDLKFTNFHVCRCSNGFQRDRLWQNCIDMDECATTPSVCGKGAISCTNTIGGYRCHCENDQTTSNEPCLPDIDECSETPSRCGANSVNCTNTYGSYICLCKDGRSIYNGSCVVTGIGQIVDIGVIIGAVLGSVLGTALVALVTIVAVRWYRRKHPATPPAENPSRQTDVQDTVLEQQYSSLVKMSDQPNDPYSRLNVNINQVVSTEVQPVYQNSGLSNNNTSTVYEQLNRNAALQDNLSSAYTSLGT